MDGDRLTAVLRLHRNQAGHIAKNRPHRWFCGISVIINTVILHIHGRRLIVIVKHHGVAFRHLRQLTVQHRFGFTAHRLLLRDLVNLHSLAIRYLIPAGIYRFQGIRTKPCGWQISSHIHSKRNPHKQQARCRQQQISAPALHVPHSIFIRHPHSAASPYRLGGIC